MIEACGRYGEGTDTCRVLVEKHKERDHWKDVDVDEKIILKCILKESIERAWIVFIWLRVERQLADSSEHGIENSGSIKCGEFL
jgi:hypothetical protein